MSSPTGTPLLSVRGLTMRFGGILALSDVNFDIQRGSISAMIGPNGAGKTTVFNCITGFYRATGGSIHYRSEDKDINLVQVLGEKLQSGDFLNPPRLASRLYYKMFGGSHRVAQAGVARTFQNIRLFREMTAIENLLVAQHAQIIRNPISGVLQTPAFRRSEREAIDRAHAWLKVVGLEKDVNRLAGELPYGHQRRLEIARSMATGPQLVCLDEPAAGLNPKETEELTNLIRVLRDQHQVTVLLIEHDMGMVMDVSEQIVVLDHGVIIAEGTPHDIENNPAVLAAYLGEDYSATAQTAAGSSDGGQAQEARTT
ncbi:ATP-binding cassette domain-containing protein [Geopsychrobacter electrodiphilus]|uniref:ATP-binding cassette domain-containing protein n=1 Tax=Geopsychrobacter electrodiphilus TaxID=225196 RepID=UPI00035C33AD|nr:ATP-binding cassette domain-containing protein [Geopsychrobacter electrodiphilus]